MGSSAKLTFIRLLPVLFISASAMAYIAHVEGPGDYAWRNQVPLVVLVALSAVTLYRGGGSWIGNGWRWPLGTLGFAIPALGLSLYLHHAYSINLESLFGEAKYPEELFRFLPIYTLLAGTIGFAIGWIVGRNV